MIDDSNELNFNIGGGSEPEIKEPENKAALKHTVFKFDIRFLAFWTLSKWRWIIAVFVVSLVVFWAVIKYLGTYSDNAWTASAKVFHQTRSEKIPSFYKPVETSTVMQFIASRDVGARVAKKMQNALTDFKRSMLSTVEVTADKSKKHMVIISASANSPENAAAIANAVAEEGISEYVRRQNNSMQIMSEERKSQRDEIEREVAQLEAEAEKFNSPITGLPPDIELTKLRDEISILTSRRDETIIHLQGIDARRKTTEETLKGTPRNVEFETVIDNSGAMSLEGKKAELAAMRERYTDDNPKVKILMSEVSSLEEEKKNGAIKPPQKISYRKNSAYAELEIQLSNIKIDELSSKVLREKYDYEIKTKRAKIASLLEKNKEFTLLNRRIKMLQNKSAKISDNINDIEFIIGSAVPDVYLFESAKKPSSSNMRKAQIKILAFSAFTTFAFVFGLVGYRISRMRIVASSEFRGALGVDDLGEMPKKNAVSEEEYAAAVHKIRRNILQAAEGGKRFALFKFDSLISDSIDGAINEILNISATNGRTSFRLKCVPPSEKPEISNVDKNDEIAASLISVVKESDVGVFCFQNGYCLDVAEIDLLKFDLAILSKNYDIIVIETACGENSALLVSQLAKEVNYCVLSAQFDKTPKFTLLENIEQIRMNSETKVGGILFDVVKPYYKS